uniref:Uncharacterized protein n=1 Tax=Naja naja TaxID=35670 RepID=A0A8C6X800_NAJNA
MTVTVSPGGGSRGASRPSGSCYMNGPVAFCLQPPPPVPAALRIIRDLRPNSKQSRATRDQVVHPESHAGGGSGRDSRPLQHRVKKGPPSGCFGLKLDRIGTMSGLGCNGLFRYK